MLRRRVLTSAACVLAALAYLGCDSQSSSDSAQPAGTGAIKIGHFASMSGDTATFGQSTDKGIRLALKEINANGGILGRQVEVITEDDRSITPKARTAAQKLIDRDNVVALLGEVASSRSIAAAPVAESRQVPMLSPSSTNPQVTQGRDYVFRACFIDPFQGTAMARFAMEESPEGLGLERFAILYPVNSDYGVGLAEFFEAAVKSRGGTIVAKESYSEKQDKDFTGQLTNIRAADPQAIFVSGYYTEVGLIAQQAHKLGLDMPLLGGDGWESSVTIQSGGEAVEGCYFSTHVSLADPRPVVQQFLQNYHAEYGENDQPDAMTVQGYDAMKLLAAAIERAGSTDGPAIRNALAATENFPGVAGEITMDENGDAVKPLVVLTINDGQFEFVRTIEPE